MKKIKRYRLGISRTFPNIHPLKGEPTQFIQKIGIAIGCPNCKLHMPKKHNTEYCVKCCWKGKISPKLHTIRANYPLWKKRMEEVQAGLAVIELFYWAGKPYHKDENGVGQIVFATLDKDSGCGVQEL